MADARATIVVEARDEATEAIKTLTSAVNDLNATMRESKTATEQSTETNKQSNISWTDIAAQLYIVKNAVSAVVGVYNQLTSETIAVAAQQRDLSRVAGTSVEDAGKLIQAADDMTVSYGTVEAAARRMVMNGIAPSMDNIAALADKYVALQDPVARSQLLLDNFGRSGLEMGKLLEQGGAGVKALGDNAVATGIVLSGDGVKAMREYEIATDNASDAILGMKMKLAQELVPAVTDYINLVLKNVSVQDQLKSAFEQGIITEQEMGAIQGKLQFNLMSLSDATSYLHTATLQYISTQTAASNALTNWRDETEKSTTFTTALATADDSLGKAAKGAGNEITILNAALAGGLGKDAEKNKKDQADLQKQQSDLTAELEKYTAANGQAYGPAANLSQLQNQQAQAAFELAQAQASLTQAQGDLATSQAQNLGLDTLFTGNILAAKVAIDQKTEALAKADKAVADASGGIANYSGKIKETKDKLADVNAALDANAKQHDIATKTILLGYAEQALAANGLTTTEIGYLTQLGEKWGVYDKGTATAVAGVLDSVDRLNANGKPESFIIGMDDALVSAQNLDKSDAQLASTTQAAIDLSEGYDGVSDGLKTVAKETTTNTIPTLDKLKDDAVLPLTDAVKGTHDPLGIAYNDLIGIKGAADSAAEAWDKLIAAMNATPGHVGPYNTGDQRSGEQGGYAMGADFIVPPGYLNDSYIMRVQSGEHVTVTPQGQRDPSGRGAAAVNINGPILNNNVDIEILARRVAEYMTAAA